LGYSIRKELGTTLLNLGKPRDAVGDFRKALELLPESVPVANNLAWILATSSDTALRDGEEAVRLAEQASKGTDGNNLGILDTLAAAYAEAGRFDEAVETAEKAVDLARSQGKKLLATDIEGRLRL
jgi:cytochrome c-type biogenesis protein CcmH/NrfG